MVEQINIKPDVVLDLGNKGCGDLAISLMIKMKTVGSGQVLEVHALDTGAQNDIPAWCRMTKNELLAGPCGEGNAFYYIKKKIQ